MRAAYFERRVHKLSIYAEDQVEREKRLLYLGVCVCWLSACWRCLQVTLGGGFELDLVGEDWDADELVITRCLDVDRAKKYIELQLYSFG